jgi:hypothetical protein
MPKVTNINPTSEGIQERADFIAGLCNLADFLASNPTVPVPRFGTSILVSAQWADDKRGFVDEFATLTGVEIDDRWDADGHYSARAAFGPVEYEAYAVSKPAMDAHDALWSYRDCVQPEAASVELGEAA